MSEQFYDKEIAPALLALAEKCHDAGIPFVACVEYEPGNYGTTADLPTTRGMSVEWAYVAARCNGNVDALIGHIIKQARKYGHNSMYLHMLGVPTEAEEGNQDEGIDFNIPSIL